MEGSFRLCFQKNISGLRSIDVYSFHFTPQLFFCLIVTRDGCKYSRLLLLSHTYIHGVTIGGVHKLCLTFSPAKPRNISIFEPKKPMMVKKRVEVKIFTAI